MCLNSKYCSASDTKGASFYVNKEPRGVLIIRIHLKEMMIRDNPLQTNAKGRRGCLLGGQRLHLSRYNREKRFLAPVFLPGSLLYTVKLVGEAGSK